MDLSGEYRIQAPRDAVWTALNDVDVLQQAIPGCQEIDKESDTAFTAKVKSKIGPVSATFKGKVTLSDLDPPNGYTISGEGQGGVAGFAKGGARVTLEDDGGATILRYVADGQVGGKLAQVGSRLVEGSARKVADQFFGKFNDLVSQEVPSEASETPEATPQPFPESTQPSPAPVSGRPPYGAPEASFENLWFGFVGLVLVAFVVMAATAQ
ncbi:MAG: SRPBCC domain-containing protein [Alphaproteobacteria bacterium]|jgi:uncharacterized protein|nr:carbon monoxide dehydrogenase [Rhodospirillaceae bacterium]MBT6508943.1 carbon monoxide dehydrogenase [Rhodospirillaceae bacterium]MBT7613176.1 carbon monoxide dehydrogenase [Rhodospirillaceae bacterium]MBT7649095.1 carbon monoxide dehydrogenase [Rhodospirillaceae bacterium]MDG2481844.1 SRPBCC domain-containing protein [Alphaproteobacteria bacterium]